MAESGFFKMTEERREEFLSRFLFRSRCVAPHAHPRFDKWSNEPGPYRALMIRAVALQDPAFLMRFVIRFTGCERAQAERRQQFFFDQRDDLFRALAVEQLKWQSADGEDLIWTERGVPFTCAMVGVNHV